MGIKKTLRQSRTVMMIYEDVMDLWSRLKRRRQSRDISAYLQEHDIHYLQIGAGPTIAEGWLCTDVTTTRGSTVYLDATKPFPIGDEVFDLVYSEHMFEHISFEKGEAMLRECYRILRPGGRIRLATPDLKRLLGLYGNASGGIEKRYVDWIAENVLRKSDRAKPVFIINNAFRNWGHQFLYDEDTLRELLMASGFTEVERFDPGESKTEAFRGLERHGSNIGDEEINRFETMVLEAVRP